MQTSPKCQKCRWPSTLNPTCFHSQGLCPKHPLPGWDELLCEEQLAEVDLKAGRGGIVAKVKLSKDGKLFYFRKWFCIMCCLWKIVVAQKNPPQFTSLSGQLEHSLLFHACIPAKICLNTPGASLQLYQLLQILLCCLSGVLRKHRKFQVQSHSDTCPGSCRVSWPSITTWP